MERPTKYNTVSEDYYLQFCDKLKLLHAYNLISKLTNNCIIICLGTVSTDRWLCSLKMIGRLCFSNC